MREDYLNSDTTSSPKDKEFENILRPKSFKDFYGQEQIINTECIGQYEINNN